MALHEIYVYVGVGKGGGGEWGEASKCNKVVGEGEEAAGGSARHAIGG